MNSRVVGEQSRLVKSIYKKGKLAHLTSSYMKLFQLVLYSFILFLILKKGREWDSIDKYVLLIAVFGGFLFSLMWEAKTRYVFPYLLMELPYMAVGTGEIVKVLETRISRNIRK